MDKRSLHHIGSRIATIHIGYFLLPFILSSVITVMALRDNNLRMIQLQNEVYKADETNTDIEGSLQRLRQHIHAHMNTDPSTVNNVYPPIQLQHTYQRLVAAEKQRVQQQTANVYTDAQRFCEQQNPSGVSGRGRVPCIEAYVTERKVTERKIPDAMYKFDFVSPRWSPDLAGFSLVASIVLFVSLIVRVAARRIMKLLTI